MIVSIMQTDLVKTCDSCHVSCPEASYLPEPGPRPWNGVCGPQSVSVAIDLQSVPLSICRLPELFEALMGCRLYKAIALLVIKLFVYSVYALFVHISVSVTDILSQVLLLGRDRGQCRRLPAVGNSRLDSRLNS
jgi:hypothetical protein